MCQKIKLCGAFSLPQQFHLHNPTHSYNTLTITQTSSLVTLFAIIFIPQATSS